jgi:DNA modification methylase
MEYRCLNDMWVECTDNERWDKEHQAVRAREEAKLTEEDKKKVNYIDSALYYKCDKDKNSCGFNKSLLKIEAQVQEIKFDFKSNAANVGKGGLCNQLAPKEESSKPQSRKAITTNKPVLAGFEDLVNIKDNKPRLEAKFIVPPFSILDTKQGYWQDRKRQWISLGIRSELGRGGELTFSITPDGRDVGDNSIGYTNTGKDKAKAFKAQDSLLAIMKDKSGLQANSKDSSEKGWVKSKNSLGNLTERFQAGETVTDTVARIAGCGTGTSIFDPVLCELMYKWFCKKGGVVLDPFAGGSVRGIVANYLGYKYSGIDLNDRQILANIEQAKEIVPNNIPNWYVGNSLDIDSLLPKDFEADFIFSCPPYFDLEIYSEDKQDLSNMDWYSFKESYTKIIAKAISRLKINKFACFVVSEIRNKDGYYRGFVPYTIESFQKGGMEYYNELILVNVVGSLPVRVNNQMNNRKIGRMHQNVLVFYKGKPEHISTNFNDIDTEI